MSISVSHLEDLMPGTLVPRNEHCSLKRELMLMTLAKDAFPLQEDHSLVMDQGADANDTASNLAH